jgi:hypothetical protein
METSQAKKIAIALLILLVLAAAGFAFSYLAPDSGPQPADIFVGGTPNPTPSTLDEEVAEDTREKLEAPAPTNIDKTEVREEISQPASGGGLSEAEKERIRAELRK